MPQDKETYSNGNGHKTRNWKLYVAAIAFSIGMLAITGFGAYTVIRGQQINKQLCRFSDDNRTAIVNILLAVERNALEQATTIREVDEIEDQTNELLALVPPIKCTIGGTPTEIERRLP